MSDSTEPPCGIYQKYWDSLGAETQALYGIIRPMLLCRV